MLLRVNGKERRIEKAATLQDVIAALGYEGDFFAVALNRACIPRGHYGTTPVQEQDDIEILSPMQGG
jgi:sulfur carrier protein